MWMGTDTPMYMQLCIYVHVEVCAFGQDWVYHVCVGLSVGWWGSHFCFEGKAQTSDTHIALEMPGGWETEVTRSLHKPWGEEGQISGSSKPKLPVRASQGRPSSPQRIWHAVSWEPHSNGPGWVMCPEGLGQFTVASTSVLAHSECCAVSLEENWVGSVLDSLSGPRLLISKMGIIVTSFKVWQVTWVRRPESILYKKWGLTDWKISKKSCRNPPSDNVSQSGYVKHSPMRWSTRHKRTVIKCFWEKLHSPQWRPWSTLAHKGSGRSCTDKRGMMSCNPRFPKLLCPGNFSV